MVWLGGRLSIEAVTSRGNLGGVEAVDPCVLSASQGISLALSSRLVAGAFKFTNETGRLVTLISGARSEAEQDALRQQGRPTAPRGVSTHTSCPATGADLRIGLGPTRVLKAILGRTMVMEGLRWGGGGAVDSGGIPADWNHFDLGPRRTSP